MFAKKYFAYTAVIMVCFPSVIVGNTHSLNQASILEKKPRIHESSRAHKEAKLKWMARGMPTITTQLSSQMRKKFKKPKEMVL